MSDGQPSDAYRCGQSYAALAALERLGSPSAKASLDRPGERSKASQNPRGTLKAHLDRAVTYLMHARSRRKGPEAAAIFRSIPELLPAAKDLPSSLGFAQQDDFSQGWHAQVKALEAAPR